MSRPSRNFRADSFVLEARRLLAAAHASTPLKGSVLFKTTADPMLPLDSTLPAEEVVGQQDGQALVELVTSNVRGKLQVRVTTDPTSPAVGVNVGALDQTVTFARNQAKAFLTVPLIAGAPNPGEVDVNVNVTPLTPNASPPAPLKLRVLASDATIAPRIVSVQGAPQGIVLTFNKPMDPAGASNVNNYALGWTSTHDKYSDLGPFSILMPGSWPSGVSSSSGSARLQSAQYDPATRSVTLTTKRRIQYSSLVGLTVTDGQFAGTSNRPGAPSNLGPPLTDLTGNPIVSLPGATPGFFSYPVVKGLQWTT